MADTAHPTPDLSVGLAHAVILSFDAPVLLLDADLKIVAASRSFCRSFKIDAAAAIGLPIAAIGNGEWAIPQLDGLLLAAASGSLAVENYEMDLKREGHIQRRLMINAHKLDYGTNARTLLLLSVTDITDARSRDKQKDTLVREKAMLLDELQHRVANSLQIIASVLMQSARRVQSDETRTHLYDAHSRVMSVAALQQQLAASQLADVGLKLYLTNLCRSIGASMIRDHDTMNLDVEVDDSSVNAEASISLGLIVTELVINSLRHGFPGQRGGRIVVRYQAYGPDWTLSVADNGVGIAASRKCPKGGLGTNIVKALAMQLDATISTTDAAPGTTVSITHHAD